MADLLQLHCFGQFQIERNGQPVALPTRKTESLLAYLVLHPEVHARERLAALFWGEFGDEEARRSLRTALSALRKALGQSCLLADRATVQFNPEYPVWADVLLLRAQSQRFLRREPPDPALVDVELYQGDLLSAFYDEWILREQEEARLLYLDVLLRLTQHWRSQGDYSRAIAAAQRILALEPAEEQAHQHLMACYAALGNRSAALQQYDACVRALREELGVAPSPETAALYRRIQRAPPRARSSAAAVSNLPTPLTSFIGRAGAIARLKGLLMGGEAAPANERARLITLTGPGGCGKTRLAIQAARELLDLYADGVWWVELAALSDPAQIPQAVARVLNVQQQAQPSLTDLLANHLRARQMLLLLDNCEHLVGACAELAERLLSRCPDLQILATSRESLGVQGETSWLTPPLSLPGLQAGDSPAALLQFESVRLFVERAGAARNDFAFTPANAQAV